MCIYKSEQLLHQNYKAKKKKKKKTKQTKKLPSLYFLNSNLSFQL